MDVRFILIYSATVFVASIIPGPSMILALSHGIRYGARRALATALGNSIATLIQALLSIAGLGAIMLHSEIAFSLIKGAGAVYLIYLGIKVFGTPLDFDLSGEGNTRNSTVGKLFSEAFIVTIGNPKAIIFFTALFPQFINSNHDTQLQFATILTITVAVAFGSMMLYASFGEKLVSWLDRANVGKMFNRATGLTFIGLGIGFAPRPDQGRPVTGPLPAPRIGNSIQ